MQYLRQVAIRTQKTAVELKRELKLNVILNNTQQLMRKTPYLFYRQCKPASYLKKKHRENRIKWAREKLEDMELN